MIKVHFIAVGGSIMHNLAIALKNKGFEVSGSDDEIFEPSYSRLKAEGILPEQMGWHPEKVTADIDAVVLGMHAREDNPELLKAQELGLKIYSYPEYIFEQSKEKQRVVIAGSHGKTTVTSMIIHVLNYWNKSADYLLGASLKGISNPVKLTDEAPVIIIEGDEYLTSAVDRRPKFLNYHHHIGVITGIAWDHVNVYPDYNEYEKQFKIFAEATPKGGILVYCEADKTLKKLIKGAEIDKDDVVLIPYTEQKNKVKNGVTYLRDSKNDTAIKVFGKHNLENISAALGVCIHLGLTKEQFYEAIATFEGASFRMEVLAENASTKIYRDFAHAPSKVKATASSFAKQFSSQKNTVCLELHTFSSLNRNFIGEYADSLSDIDEAIVYYNPATVERKKLDPVSEDLIRQSFKHKNLQVFTDSAEVLATLKAKDWTNKNLLLMTSGNFDGLNLKEVAEGLL